MSFTKSSSSNERPKAVLVAVQFPETSDEEHAADLAELGRLAHTCGLQVVGAVSQKRGSLSSAAVLGEGKLKTLARWTGGTGKVGTTAPRKESKARNRGHDEDTLEEEEETPSPWPGLGSRGTRPHGPPPGEDTFDEGDEDSGPIAEGEATVVIVDHEITPSQLRNLERATGAEVMDRSGLIVEIFHRHAKSREARLQVEIARLHYLAPRLREVGAGADRQRGGIGGKGAGETAVELDRRRIRDRIAELRRQIDAIQREQANRRAHRHGQRRVALVGYTNAGKSSLMRALTGSHVLVEDKLFATLDTTVRALHPEVKPRILISDTVGFIKKLPHDLVASFRSTLDEALEASFLLFVADASDPTFRSQLDVTHAVLKEIGATDIPSRLLLNKVDRLSASERQRLQKEFPDALMLSAHDPRDVENLRAFLIEHFDRDLEEGDVLIPYDRQQVLGAVYEDARVIGESYDEGGLTLKIRALPGTLARLQELAAHAPAPKEQD